MSFTLSEGDRAVIEDMVKNGRFASKSEVIRASLRLLQDYENDQKIKRLRAEIAVGDSDLVAGRVTRYDDAGALYDDIMKG